MLDLMRRYIELTEVDSRRVELARHLERYPELIAKLDKAEAELQAKLTKAQSAQEAARTARRTAEREVENQRSLIKKYTVRQADVKTTKEYEALTGEIARAHEQIDTQETLGLELLDQEETAQAAAEASDKSLAALKAEHAGERARIAEQTADKQARLERLNEEYAEDFARLDDSEQEEYDLVRRRHPGSACAAVAGDHCGGCSRTLVAHVIQEVAQAERLIQCEYCRRFLVPAGSLHS